MSDPRLVEKQDNKGVTLNPREMSEGFTHDVKTIAIDRGGLNYGRTIIELAKERIEWLNGTGEVLK